VRYQFKPRSQTRLGTLHIFNRLYMIHKFITFYRLFRPPPRSKFFPYTTLFRSARDVTGSSRTTRARSHHPAPSATCRHATAAIRSEEHTSELQSRFDLVCRLLLEKKKDRNKNNTIKVNELSFNRILAINRTQND